MFLKAAYFLNLQPGECIVVEDVTAGIDTGKNGGFTTFYIGPSSDYKITDYPLRIF